MSSYKNNSQSHNPKTGTKEKILVDFSPTREYPFDETEHMEFSKWCIENQSMIGKIENQYWNGSHCSSKSKSKQ